MTTQREIVGLVLDPDYGEKILVLAKQFHVWVLDSPANRKIVQSLRKELLRHTTVTTFKAHQGQSLVEVCLGMLGTIDEHHNNYAQKSPYIVLEVVGLPFSSSLTSDFQQHGFNQFEITNEGFRAIKG